MGTRDKSLWGVVVGGTVTPKTHGHSESLNVTFSGKSVFADIIKVRIKKRSYWSRVAPKSKDYVLVTDRMGHAGKKAM